MAGGYICYGLPTFLLANDFCFVEIKFLVVHVPDIVENKFCYLLDGITFMYQGYATYIYMIFTCQHYVVLLSIRLFCNIITALSTTYGIF